jgi:hypothetical protein
MDRTTESEIRLLLAARGLYGAGRVPDYKSMANGPLGMLGEWRTTMESPTRNGEEKKVPSKVVPNKDEPRFNPSLFTARPL